MGYDIDPLQTIREKEAFLAEAVENDLFFSEHDPVIEQSGCAYEERLSGK